MDTHQTSHMLLVSRLKRMNLCSRMSTCLSNLLSIHLQLPWRRISNHDRKYTLDSSGKGNLDVYVTVVRGTLARVSDLDHIIATRTFDVGDTRGGTCSASPGTSHRQVEGDAGSRRYLLATCHQPRGEESREEKDLLTRDEIGLHVYTLITHRVIDAAHLHSHRAPPELRVRDRRGVLALPRGIARLLRSSYMLAAGIRRDSRRGPRCRQGLPERTRPEGQVKP
jgi:hypothetical protein